MTQTLKTNVNYPTNDELKGSLLETQALTIEDETNEFIFVRDEYPLQNGFSDRFIRFNKDNVRAEDLIESFGEDVQKFHLVEFLESLPKVLMMTIEKIYFVRTETHLESLYEEDKSPNHTFSLEHLGMFVWADGTIFISLPAHEEASEEEAQKDLKSLGFSDYEKTLKIGIWQTLAHELYHSLQANPLFEEEVEQGEDAAEEYCRRLFE